MLDGKKRPETDRGVVRNPGFTVLEFLIFVLVYFGFYHWFLEIHGFTYTPKTHANYATETNKLAARLLESPEYLHTLVLQQWLVTNLLLHNI